jgi:Carbohydrate family 9 binding domain-like
VRKRFAPSKTLRNTVLAAPFSGSVDATGFPPSTAWRRAKPVLFDADWQGKNFDPHRQTEVRLLWAPEFLYLKFVARYRIITVFEDADPRGRRDKLWDRDVTEVFLQPDPTQPRRYKEFEVSPNGFWIDLEITNGTLQHLQSGLQRCVNINKSKNTWTAELAIPVKSLTPRFDPASVWRVNFFRVEGPTEPRFYSAWQPTNTPQPNFHVPERFGFLKFEPMRALKQQKAKPSKSEQ